jgi:hypothetical protein
MGRRRGAARRETAAAETEHSPVRGRDRRHRGLAPASHRSGAAPRRALSDDGALAVLRRHASTTDRAAPRRLGRDGEDAAEARGASCCGRISWRANGPDLSRGCSPGCRPAVSGRAGRMDAPSATPRGGEHREPSRPPRSSSWVQPRPRSVLVGSGHHLLVPRRVGRWRSRRLTHERGERRAAGAGQGRRIRAHEPRLPPTRAGSPPTPPSRSRGGRHLGSHGGPTGPAPGRRRGRSPGLESWRGHEASPDPAARGPPVRTGADGSLHWIGHHAAGDTALSPGERWWACAWRRRAPDTAAASSICSRRFGATVFLGDLVLEPGGAVSGTGPGRGRPPVPTSRCWLWISAIIAPSRARSAGSRARIVRVPRTHGDRTRRHLRDRRAALGWVQICAQQEEGLYRDTEPDRGALRTGRSPGWGSRCARSRGAR